MSGLIREVAKGDRLENKLLLQMSYVFGSLPPFSTCACAVSVKRRSPGLVDLVPALVYHLCPALRVAFTQPGYHLLVKPCIRETKARFHEQHRLTSLL